MCIKTKILGNDYHYDDSNEDDKCVYGHSYYNYLYNNNLRIGGKDNDLKWCRAAFQMW